MGLVRRRKGARTGMWRGLTRGVVRMRDAWFRPGVHWNTTYCRCKITNKIQWLFTYIGIDPIYDIRTQKVGSITTKYEWRTVYVLIFLHVSPPYYIRNGSQALLKDTKNFTVLIKNSIEFPDCECERDCEKGQYKRRNILSNFTSEYLKTCRYHPDEHPFCPIFFLGDIVKWSGSDYDEVAITVRYVWIIVWSLCVPRQQPLMKMILSH